MEHRRRLFAASFTTLVVAGVGFAIRGAILADWATQFGFTKTELGAITEPGLRPRDMARVPRPHRHADRRISEPPTHHHRAPGDH